MNYKGAGKWLWIVLIGTACLFVLLPVLRPGFPVTDDGDWMVIRLSAFFQSFREGQFPVRFLGRLNNHYGYPVANFLYPGFLYIGSVLRISGIPFQNIIEIILAGSVVTGVIGVYLWLRRFFSLRAGAAGALSFLFMPYLLYDMYKRGSVGEVLATGACAVALYAAEARKTWLLVPAVALLAISHNTLALLLLIFLSGYILIKRLRSLMLPFILGIGMSSFFWLPVIFEQSFVLFNAVTVSDPLHFFPASHRLILLSFPVLAAAVISLVLKKAPYKNERAYFITVLCISVFLSSGLSISLWQNTALVRYIQFPYRFLAIWCFIGPWLIAYVTDSWTWMRGFAFALPALVFLCLVSIPYQRWESVIRPEGYYVTNESTTTGTDEYMPVWVTKLPSVRAPVRLEIAKGNAVISERKVTTSRVDVSVHAEEDSIVQFNTIYYPGWGAMLDNKPAIITYDNPGGLMRVSVPAGDHDLYMAFRETPGRFAADVISGICIVTYIAYLSLYIYKRKIKHNK
jgi:hypothetical protein